MASTKIKGITIELSADNSKLANALKETKTQLVETSRELKDVNKLLKLDPTNVTLLSQKQELLKKQITDTAERLKQLKELQQQFGDTSRLTDDQKEQYRALEREIAQCENQLKGYYSQQTEVNSAIDNVNEGQPFEEVSKDIDDAGKSALKMGDIIKANLISEAIISGIKGLANGFKSLASNLNEWSSKANTLQEQEAKVSRVMKNTTNATDDQVQAIIDLTAQQEKLGVVSQETQLAGLQELGTYVEHKESLEKLLPVMNDMIAQQYGIGASMESASGIATMMGKVLGNGQVDALSRLGYKFNDAQKQVLKFGTEEEKVAMLTEIIEQSVGGMNKALAQTDAGRMQIAKSYFEDFQKTAGKTFNDFKNKVVSTFLPQIMNVTTALQNMLTGKIDIKNGMQQIINTLSDGLKTIKNKLPQFLQTGTEIIKSLIQGLVDGLPEIVPTIVDILMQLVQFIIDNLPIILDGVIQVVLQVAQALGEQLPTLIPVLVDGILKLVDTILDNIDLFVDASIEIIMGLADGLINALPKLIEKAPEIVEKLVKAIIKNAPKMQQASAELIWKLIVGLRELDKDLVVAGARLILKLWEGIQGKLDWLWERVKAIGNNVLYYLSFGMLGENDTSILDTANNFIEKTEKGLNQAVTNDKQDLQNVGVSIGKAINTGTTSSMSNSKGQEIGKDFVNGIQLGVQNKTKVQQAVNAVQSTALALVNKAKSILKISSPSKVTEEIGKFFDEGLQVGIEENTKQVVGSAQQLSKSLVGSVDGIVADTDMAMRSLSSDVSASVNPTINPTANSNPLYITIDKFYNNRATDVQQLAQELEFYRKNSALAKGGA
jgi:cell pole-organizing protein PopZ